MLSTSHVRCSRHARGIVRLQLGDGIGAALALALIFVESRMQVWRRDIGHDGFGTA